MTMNQVNKPKQGGHCMEMIYAPRNYLCLAHRNLPKGTWYVSKRYDFYATYVL